MASRTLARIARRTITTSAQPGLTAQSSTTTASAPTTHYKITLRRSAISLGDRIKATLESLGIHRRHQTVYHRHTPEAAGKILRVKELVDVENVPDHLVKTKQEMRRDRMPPRGYKVVGKREGVY